MGHGISVDIGIIVSVGIGIVVGVGIVVPPHGQLLMGLGSGGVSSVVMVGPGAVVVCCC